MIKLVSVKLLHSLTKIDGNSNGVGTIKSAQKTCLSLTKKKDKCLNDAHFRLKKKLKYRNMMSMFLSLEI